MPATAVSVPQPAKDVGYHHGLLKTLQTCLSLLLNLVDKSQPHCCYSCLLTGIATVCHINIIMNKRLELTTNADNMMIMIIMIIDNY